MSLIDRIARSLAADPPHDLLLGDLVEQGFVLVQATITESSSNDERLELIERTLRGLRNY